MKSENYLGWKNKETWNVALWLSNDYEFYQLSKTFYKYSDLAKYLKAEFSEGTKDGVKWDCSKLDYKELDELISEM